jgi:hypothetical protein
MERDLEELLVHACAIAELPLETWLGIIEDAEARGLPLDEATKLLLKSAILLKRVFLKAASVNMKTPAGGRQC